MFLSGLVYVVHRCVESVKPEYKQKPIRSYVIRAGRMTEGQKKAFDKSWSVYGLSLFHGRINPDQVFRRKAPLVLEIGFGMGDSLLEMAQSATDTNFIGIEVHPPGVGRLMHQAQAAGVDNLRLFMADAIDVLEDCIPDNSLDRVQIFFPDPWHKKKHHKRRIINPEFVDKLWYKLKAGAVLHIATDWEHYAEYIMEVLCCAEGFCNTVDEYHFASRPDYRPKTKFEHRGERLGHPVWDIIFRKQQPEILTAPGIQSDRVDE